MKQFIRFEQLHYQYPFQTKCSQSEQKKDHNKNLCSPSQLPSSLIFNPSLQVHPKEPIVLEQYELGSQLERRVIHSSISKKVRGNLVNLFTYTANCPSSTSSSFDIKNKNKNKNKTELTKPTF